MEALQALWESLVQLSFALREVVLTLGAVLLPWLPLAAWVAFWTFAVNWVKLRQALLVGGWVGVVLVGVVTVLVWGTVAPPPDGYHYLLGLTVTNYVGKTVYVTILFCIALLCGAVQLSGCCGPVSRFEEDDLADAEPHAAAPH